MQDTTPTPAPALCQKCEAPSAKGLCLACQDALFATCEVAKRRARWENARLFAARFNREEEVRA